MKILKAIGITLALVAIYYFAQSTVGFVLGFIKAMPIIMQEIASGTQPDIGQITQELMSIIAAQTPFILIFSVVIALPSYYLIYKSRRQELMTFLSFRAIGAVSIPVLVIFGLSVNFMIEWLLSLASLIPFLEPVFRQYEQLAEFITGGSFVLSLLAVGIIGPFFEEVLFRGLIFGELRKIMKVKAVIVIQAVLFGIYHLNIVQGSYAVLIGLLLGFVCYRSSSIIAPMIVHMTINASTVILNQFASGDNLDAWTGAIIAASIILFLASGAFILVSRRFRHTMDDSLYFMNRIPKTPPVGE